MAGFVVKRRKLSLCTVDGGKYRKPGAEAKASSKLRQPAVGLTLQQQDASERHLEYLGT